MAIIGFGKDIHNLAIGNEIRLAGTNFESKYKILAHSDGDIIYHSLSNAILSSLGLNDIGYYFSDNDPKNKNLNSENILNFCLNKLKNSGFNFVNIVVCITCQKIKIAPLREAILNKLKEKLAPYFHEKNKILISLHATSFEDTNNYQIQVDTVINIV